MSRSKTDLLSLALKLDRRLTRAARHPAAPWPIFRVPQLWAGFKPRDISKLRFAASNFEKGGDQILPRSASHFETSLQSVDNLILYPLESVNGQLPLAHGVFAEIRPTMRSRVFRVNNVRKSLTGVEGASSFDFLNSRYFRPPLSDPACRSLKGCKQLAIAQ